VPHANAKVDTVVTVQNATETIQPISEKKQYNKPKKKKKTTAKKTPKNHQKNPQPAVLTSEKRKHVPHAH
jgi:hypothetical protein